MTVLAFVLAVIASFYAGYKYEKLLASIKGMRELLNKKVDVKEKEFSSNTSDTVIDPFDEIQKAKFAHDELMRSLNPDERS